MNIRGVVLASFFLFIPWRIPILTLDIDICVLHGMYKHCSLLKYGCLVKVFARSYFGARSDMILVRTSGPVGIRVLGSGFIEPNI